VIAGVDASAWVAVLIAAAVAAGVIRLGLWHRSVAPADRGPVWRLATLVGLQVAAGLLLHLTLFPPGGLIRSGTLIVATRNAPTAIALGAADTLVALPEAGTVARATRVPDLATALRRFPSAARIRVIGEGLPPRDIAPLAVPLDFAPPPPPHGLVEIALPAATVPGAGFAVAGRIGSLASGVVELVDPAGVVVDRVRVARGQAFVLRSSARAAGLVLFDLRLKGTTDAVIERIAVPVDARAQTPPRVLVLGGAPGPESKYLSRWASDNGIDLMLNIDIGAGLRLGDPVPLTQAALAQADLVVMDERRWEALSGSERASLMAAIDRGLGLLLRPTGPLSAGTRRDWAGLGLSLTGGEETAPTPLVAPTAPSADGEGTGGARGTGSGGGSGGTGGAGTTPVLTRRDLLQVGPDAVTVLRDAAGVATASLAARGRGRVGVWTVTDSYALVLAGQADRYGALWSTLFSALARAGDDSRAEIEALARAGGRVGVCRLIGEASVVGPDGRASTLLVDPATGDRACAAVWPDRAGWHLVRDGQGRETAFYVQPSDATPSLVAAETRAATLAVAATPPTRSTPTGATRAPGPPWLWFGLLLAVLAGLWWLERNRPGRELPQTEADIRP